MTTARIRGEEQPGFLEVLTNWLPHQWWFPAPRGRWSQTRVGGLRLPTPKGDADSGVFLELHILQVTHSAGSGLVSVPVSFRSRPSVLAGKSAFIGKLTTEEGEDLWIYDGARDRAFLTAWLEMARRRQGSRNGRSRGETLAGFEDWDPFTLQMRRSSVESIQPGFTRTLISPEDASEDGDWDRKVVVDFVRQPVLSRDEALDTVFTLTEAHSTVIPRILGRIFGSWEVQRTTEATATSAVWQSGDLAIIREATAQAPDGLAVARKTLHAGKSFAEDARRIGDALGTFHADLAGAFGAHPQTPAQLKDMAHNAQSALSDQWAQVRAEFDEDEAADLNEVIDLMTMQLRDADEPLMLQRVHGEIGLRHAHCPAKDRWVFSEEDGMVEHAPGLRDLVTMLMSAASMVMEIASETPEINEQEARSQAPVNFGQWYEEFTRAFLEGYRGSDANTSDVDSVFFRAAMLTEALELFSRWEGQWVFRPSMLLQVEG